MRFRSAVFLSALAFIGARSDARAGSYHKACAVPKGATVAEALSVARACLQTARIGTDRIGGDNAVLGVWKPGDRKVSRVQVLGGIARTKGFRVTLLRKNGVNSEYRVDAPEDAMVLAIRTNVRARMGRGRKRSRPVVYAPYGPHLDDVAFVESGWDYLVDLADRAATRLDKREVASRVDPSALVTEMVSERIVITLMVIEHIDPDDFDARGVETTVERVFSLVGANREDSYDYAVSKASAGGLAQFIHGTYARTRDRYIEAKLLEDYVEGMRDHRNAVMATYCLIDWSIAQLSPAGREALSRNEEDLGAFVAAAYNGGERRAAKAYAEDPERWEEPGRGLATGATVYVREFRAVYRRLWQE